MHYRAISNTLSHLEVFRFERINTAKQKDGLTSFLGSSVLETKIYQVSKFSAPTIAFLAF